MAKGQQQGGGGGGGGAAAVEKTSASAAGEQQEEQRSQGPRQEADRSDAKEWSSVFKELDLNDNGSLDEHEIQAGLEKLGLPSSETRVHEMMEMVDANKDGSISYGEFVSFAEAREKELRQLFDQLDLNGNGFIEPSEIRIALDKLGMSKEVPDSAIMELIDRLGVDHSKGLNFQDFKRILMLFPSRNVSIENVFDYWFRQIIDTGDELPIIEIATVDSPFKRLFAGGVAGAVSRTATAPFDRLKMLLQAQNSKAEIAGSAHGKHIARSSQGVEFVPEYRGIWNSIKRIYIQSGWRGFFKGNGTNLIKIAPESGIKFWAYESLKRVICRDNSAPTIQEKLIAGSTAGAISQTAIYPLEIVKTRLAVAEPGAYRGILHCMDSTITTQGLRGLFRGLVPSVVGMVPYAGVDFAVYSSLRSAYTRRYPESHPGIITVFMCGALSSTCGQVVAYPLQLVRTRLQTQGMPGRPMLYTGMVDAFANIWKYNGFLGAIIPL